MMTFRIFTIAVATFLFVTIAPTAVRGSEASVVPVPGQGQDSYGSSSSSTSRSLLFTGFLRRRAKPIAALQLLDARNGNVLAEIKNGTALDVTSVMVPGVTPAFSIRALSLGSRTRAVGFVVSTVNVVGATSLMATSSPYLLCGKTIVGAIQPCAQLGLGTTHTITATAYSCRNARCGASTPYSLSFTIGPVPVAPTVPQAVRTLSPVNTPVTAPINNPSPVPPPMVMVPAPVSVPVVTIPISVPVVPFSAPVATVPTPVPVASVPIPAPVAAPISSPMMAPLLMGPAPTVAVAPVLAPLSSSVVKDPVPAPMAKAPTGVPRAVATRPPTLAPKVATKAPKAVTRAPVNRPPSVYSCSSVTDTCSSTFNGKCDSGLTCSSRTDCFDCDPCQKYAFTSCDTCTTAREGCLWCGSDASCLSPGTAVPKTSTCKVSDYTHICMESPLFTDPLFDSMLWLYNMINVQDVWRSGITGKGIGIRINDDGVDSSHPEFSSKFDVESSCSIYTPFKLDKDNKHGTTCASIAAGSGNSSCSVGIAPDARLSACRILGSNQLTPEASDQSFFHVKMANMHISSNSFGIPTCVSKLSRGRLLNVQQCPFLPTASGSPCQSNLCAGVDWTLVTSYLCQLAVIEYCSDPLNYEKDVQGCASFLDLFVSCRYNSISLDRQQALMEGITNGRGGKGIVYVVASGNDFGNGADVNFAGFQNSRHVISVGAVGKDKLHSRYSTPGAALFVSAPGGDFETKPNNVVAMPGGGCVDGGVGTSFAAPVVSGVVALILQVNNNISWRDVQGIIATTSQKLWPQDASWSTNAAGRHHSYKYGFGVIDAKAAVEAAKTWINYSAEQQIIVESGPVNVAIAEYQTPSVWAVSSVTVAAASSFTVESVNVYLELSHSSRGDLDIFLVSPQGTSSFSRRTT